jgi:formylmethanofuran--tetrahydromethanopterin N-formyltransferase
MYLGPTFIEDTYAEAFTMRYARVIVSAADDYWLDAAVREFSGYGASIIGCDAEVGREGLLPPSQSPDGRPAAALLAFGRSTEALAKAVANRAGQCVLTCPTTSLFDGLPAAADRFPLVGYLKYFGDGHQMSEERNGRNFWKIPVMDGEFLVEETAGLATGVAGGNLLIQGRTLAAALAAARRAVAAIDPLPGAMTPFPGGVVRSGSKVGSKYKGLIASTNDAYCPTLRGRVESKLHEGAHCVYEIIIDGTDEPSVAAAMAAAIRAAAGEGVVAISAGNYGGKLGKHHFRLRDILNDAGAT